MYTTRILLLFLFPTFLVAQETSNYTLTDTIQARILFDESIEHIKSQKFDLAFSKAKQVKDIYQALLSENDPNLAQAWYQLGRSNFYLNKFEKAIQAWDESLKIEIKIYGKNAKELLNTYRVTSTAYSILGKFEEALRNQKKLLDITQKRYGGNSLEVANAYYNISITYSQKGQPSDAFKYLEKTKEIQELNLPPNHIDLSDTYYQLSSEYLDNENNSKALFYANKVLKIRKNIADIDDLLITRAYNLIGNCYKQKGDYHQAIKYIEKAIDLGVTKLGDKHLDISYYYRGLANNYFSIGNYKQALTLYKQALSLYTSYFGELHPENANIYGDIGNIYLNQGNVIKALQYFEKSLNIRQKVFESANYEVSSSYESLALCYRRLGDTDKAISCINKALEINISTLDDEHAFTAHNYQNLGLVYLDLNDLSRAFENINKSLDLTLPIYGTNHIYNASYYYNLAMVYVKKENLIEAENYYNKSLEIKKNILGLYHPSIALGYQGLAELYAKQNQYQKSAKMLHSSLNALNYVSIDKLNEVNSIEYTFNSLFDLGQLYKKVYNKNRSKIHSLRSAYSYSKDAISVLDFYLKELKPDERVQLIDEILLGSGLAIKNGITLNQLTDSVFYLKEAFSFSELTKGYQLYSSMKNSDALIFANIPNNLLDKEYELRVDLEYLEQRKNKLLEDGMVDTELMILNLSSNIFDLKREQESFKSQLEQDYPDYYDLKYNFSTISVEEVQEQLLTENETLLEYFVADSSLYVFVLNKNDFHIEEVKKDFPLEAWVSDFRKANDSKFYRQSVVRYTESAHQLYEKLIAPVADKLKEELIIVPDGILGYLPFEALLVEPALKPIRFRTHHYLLRDKQISYAYSATLLQQMRDKQHKNEASEGLLAFAPYYDGDTTQLAELFRYADEDDKAPLKPLPNSGEEVYGIQQLLGGGQVYYHEEATEARFWEEAKNYRFLHLATHGKANDKTGDYSFLAFTQQKDSIENELLFVRDLYNLELNADMVVLSACETGIGELQRGEGIISLARGFTYAGAKSIFTTLWSVQDKSSKDLMLLFYKHLKAGMPKDKALRQAKLDYLDSLDSNPLAHPFHWSSFIGIGDMSPVQF